jgi:regulator of sirC expression with transglutaminase-like and TPR domain
MTTPGERFQQVVGGADDGINLAEAALLIAAEEYRELDVADYLAQLDDFAATLKRRLRADISQADSIIALNRYLFDELGFAGDAANYYDARNSFLNEVLDRKRGIPITLAIVYIEMGRRIGLPVQGVAFPAHFLVKCPLRDGTVILDP